MPWYLLLPLSAAAVYALSSVFIKRALAEGVSMTQSFHLTNLTVSLVFAPLLFADPGGARWDLLWQPLLVAAAFFLGTWLTFASIRLGDISLVTPLMGTKVVFVAVGMVALAGRMPSPLLWTAAALTALGVFLMGAGDFGRRAAGHAGAVTAALASGATFGLCDVLLGMWARDFGALAFLGVSTVTVGVISAVMWLAQGRPSLRLPRGARRWTWGGGGLMGAQAMLMGLALSFFADTTGINVAYASRGFWAVLLVAWVGPLLGNHERHASGKAFRWRVAGTALLTAAIVLAVVAGASLRDEDSGGGKRDSEVISD